MESQSSAAKFLNLLFAGKPDDSRILVWSLANKTSRFFLDLDEAAQYAASPDLKDVYVGCGLASRDYGTLNRAPADEVIGIPGFWLDVDIDHPAAHSKQGLPPNIEAALKIVNLLPFKPTFAIDSGYGMQLWFLFKEPWIFATEAERKQAAHTSQRWHELFIQCCSSLNYKGDSVADLSRILRIPGTKNCKVPDDPRPVKFLKGNPERRYNPEDFTELIDEIERSGGFAAQPITGNAGPRDWRHNAQVGLIIAPDRQPPIEKLTALRKKSRKFANTCEHLRPDLKDTSSSGYDQSLALFAARAEWTDQEIADLLIWHQSKFPPKHGARRPMYFRKAIDNARTAAAPDSRIERLKNRPPSPPAAVPDPIQEPEPRAMAAAAAAGPAGGLFAVPPQQPPPAAPPPEPMAAESETLEDLSSVIGLNIRRIIKQRSYPPLYSIETDKGLIQLGTVNILIEQRSLRNALATVGKYLIKRKEDEWAPIAQALLDSVTEVDVTDDATSKGAVMAWIRDYLRDVRICQTIEEADEGNHPFVKDAKLILSSSGLRKFLVTANGERNLTSHELCAMLREFGAEPRTHKLTHGERTTSRSLWTLPGEVTDYRST